MKTKKRYGVPKYSFGSNLKEGGYDQYLAMAGTGAAAYSDISSNPNATEKQKADAYYEQGKSIGTSINPIVGALWNMGDAIGAPIKNRAEKLNPDGTLVNPNKAKRNAVIGGLFNPYKAFTTRSSYAGGFKDIDGTGYAASLEKDAKEAYAAELAEQARLDAEKAAFEKQQRDNYSKAYMAANPLTGREDTSIYKMGGTLKYQHGGTHPEFTEEQLNMPYSPYEEGSTSPNPNFYSKGEDGTYSPSDLLNYRREKAGINRTEGGVYSNYGDTPLPDDVLMNTGFAKKADGSGYEDAATKSHVYNFVKANPVAGMGVSGTYKESDRGFNKQWYTKDDATQYMNAVHRKKNYRGYQTVPTKIENENGHYYGVFPNGARRMMNPKDVEAAYSANPALKTLAMGGVLESLSSDAVKAVGDTHNQDTNKDGRTGITLENNGTPYAEVENDEVISNNNVYSDRLGFAKQAEKLSKKKGTLEKKLSSTDTREVNTAKRMISIIDSQLKELFNMQESFKQENGISNEGTGKAYGGGLDDEEQEFKPFITPELMKLKGTDSKTDYDAIEAKMRFSDTNVDNNKKKYGKGTAKKYDFGKINDYSRFIDNAYNAQLIANTPKIPKPNQLEYFAEKPVNLKTDYNINPALYDVDSQFRNLQSNLDQNTANSQDARANKLTGFASTLKAKSNLYNTKENVETQLINTDILNKQGVNQRNLGNFQGIRNANLANTDKYNLMNFQRDVDIQEMKSANVANAVEDAAKMTQDKRAGDVDQQRIMTDSLMYGDGAGLTTMIGTPIMDNMIRQNPQYYKEMENILIQSEQTQGLDTFYKRYGKRE